MLPNRWMMTGLSLFVAIVASNPVDGSVAVAEKSVVKSRPPIRRDGDRDIVFSAQYYRFTGLYYHDESKKLTRHGTPGERTLEEAGPFHLYRINPNGTGLTRLTHNSHADDTQPRWSPDGKSILFLRRMHGKKPSVAVCRTDANARRVQSLYRRSLSEDSDDIPRYSDTDICHYSWSPDGKSIAVVVYTDEGKDYQTSLILLDAATGKRIKKFYAVANVAWSKTGRFLMLSNRRGEFPRILDLATGKQTSLRHISSSLRNLDFLPTMNCFVGDRVMDDRPFSYSLLFPVEKGAKLDAYRRIDWESIKAYKTADEYTTGYFPDEGRRWFSLPALGPNAVLVEAYHARTDGGACEVLRVDLATGKAWELYWTGQLVAVSPDGRRCAVATDDWTGPYKRGGRRCGPLDIVDTDLPVGQYIKEGRTISPELMSFKGGDWR